MGMRQDHDNTQDNKERENRRCNTFKKENKQTKMDKGNKLNPVKHTRQRLPK